MLEFFGLSRTTDGGFGFLREAEGAWSLAHIFFVTSLVLVMIALGVFIGLKFKNKPYESKNKVLVISGPFTDRIVEVVAVSEEKEIVTVLVEFFGRPSPTELKFNEVKKLESAE